MTPPLVADSLGKRFRRTWALRDCTLELPEGAIVGLAGPNGAGKSTLLGLATGLYEASEGSIAVLGRDPRRDASVLAEIGFVPQGSPLYRGFTVAETIRFARATNARWDGDVAGAFLARLDGGARVSALAEGDRSRLALAVALGKRPRLLLLDEPFARLDPLAAREFLRLLMDGVAEVGATVVVASHVVADLERVCDHIVLLADGRVRLAANVDELLDSHRLLTGAARPLGRIGGVAEIVRERWSGRQLTLLASTDGPVHDPSWVVERVGLEELLLAYMAPVEPLESPPPVPPVEREPVRWHG
jgi:ABC-2 type transport system ATP-binding protein